MKWIILLSIVSLVLTGCQSLKKDDPQEFIYKSKLESRTSEEFTKKLNQSGLIIEDSNVYSLINNNRKEIKFKLSKYKDGNIGYVHLDFVQEDEEHTGDLIISFDTTEINLPTIINSDGLGSPAQDYPVLIYKVTKGGLIGEWIGFFFTSDKNEYNGEITLKLNDYFWRGNY